MVEYFFERVASQVYIAKERNHHLYHYRALFNLPDYSLGASLEQVCISVLWHIIVLVSFTTLNPFTAYITIIRFRKDGIRWLKNFIRIYYLLILWPKLASIFGVW